jgi:hypothetical protein
MRAPTEESKNLAEVTRQEQAQREGTKQEPDVKGKIIEFLWHLEREKQKQQNHRNLWKIPFKTRQHQRKPV